MVNFVNLTPHQINLVRQGKDDLIIPPSGIIARATETVVNLPSDGFNFVSKAFDNIDGLPNPQKDTIFLVSMPLKMLCMDRKDVACVHQARRNDKGLIDGALSLWI